MKSTGECDSVEILVLRSMSFNCPIVLAAIYDVVYGYKNSRVGKKDATIRDRTRDLQIFSLTLSQLSYRGFHIQSRFHLTRISCRRNVFDTGRTVLGGTLLFTEQHACISLCDLSYANTHAFTSILYNQHCSPCDYIYTGPSCPPTHLDAVDDHRTMTTYTSSCNVAHKLFDP